MSTANSSFLGQIKHISGPLTELNASQGKFNKVDANVVNATSVTTQKSGVVEATVVGFAPTGYYTLAAGGELSLVDLPSGYSPTGSGDTHVITLPAGAFIKSVVIDNNGVTNTGGGTIGLGLGPYNSTIAVSAITGANLNANAVLYAEPAGPYTASFSGTGSCAAVGSRGAPPAATVPAAPNNYLNVEAVGSANTAGDFRAIVTYIDLANYN